MAEFAQAVHRWETFYFAIGGIGATLAGLVFVATALHFQRLQTELNIPLRAWSSYTLVHFAQVIVISLFFLVPEQTPLGLGIPLLVSAGTGVFILVNGIVYVIRQRQRLNFYSWMIYFILPGLIYSAMVVSAGRVTTGQTDLLSLFVIVIVGLLGLGGHNCWNLVINRRVPGVTE
jgi:hypothetical protein